MYILTGGAGFIGSCFLKKMNDEGITNILVVDNLGFEDKWKNLTGKKFSNYENKNDFYCSIEKFAGKKIKAIIHLGACSSTTEKDAEYLMHNNLKHSKILAKFAIDNNARFIYASSAATYGDGIQGFSDEEFENLLPLNCYGFTKYLFDRWLVSSKYASNYVGLKYFNVFGPNEYHKGDMASMVFKSYKQIKETGKIRLFKSEHQDYNDGEQLRDFIYVKDVVDVMWQLLNNNTEGIFNLGTGHARSWNDLARSVFSSLDLPENIEYIEMPDALKKQYQYFTSADMQKLTKEKIDLKFSTLEDSVNDYIKEHLEKDNIYW